MGRILKYTDITQDPQISGDGWLAIDCFPPARYASVIMHFACFYARIQSFQENPNFVSQAVHRPPLEQSCDRACACTSPRVWQLTKTSAGLAKNLEGEQSKALHVLAHISSAYPCGMLTLLIANTP